MSKVTKPLDRILWVDICRILAMLSIMIQHTPTHHPWVTYTTRSGVAFFFVASGFFLRKQSLSDKACMLRGAHFFFLVAFWSLVTALARGSDIFFSPRLLLRAIGVFSIPASVQLWFLRDLAIYTCLAPILFRLTNRSLLLISLLCACLFAPIDSLSLSYTLSFGTVTVPHPRGLSFFLLGMGLSFIPLDRIKQELFTHQKFFLLSFCVCNVYFLIETAHESYIALILGVLGLITISCVLEDIFIKNKISIEWIAVSGRAIFGVYATHVLVLYAIETLCNPPQFIWLLLVVPVFALSVYTLSMLKKWFPRSIRFLTCMK